MQLSRIRQAGHIAQSKDVRIACKLLIGELEGKRLCGGPSHRWEQNIRLGLKE
jgi:hypothetical protein